MSAARIRKSRFHFCSMASIGVSRKTTTQKSSENWCQHGEVPSSEQATAIVSERLFAGKEGQAGPSCLENFPVLHLTGTVRPFDNRIIFARWNSSGNLNSGELADIHYHTIAFLWKATWRCHAVSSKCLQNSSFYNNLKHFNQVALRNKMDMNIVCYFMEQVAVTSIFCSQ